MCVWGGEGRGDDKEGRETKAHIKQSNDNPWFCSKSTIYSVDFV